MARRTSPPARIGDRAPAAWRRGAVVLCALALAGCGAIEAADRNLRRIDILDRVFDPDRFRDPPPQLAAPAQPLVQAQTLAAPPETGAYETGSDALPQTWTEPPETIVRAPAEPVAAAEPERPASPDPAARRAALLRQYPWLSRFWGELDTSQQGRVSRALRRTGGQAPEDAERWDRMGLADRVRLVFGGA